MDETTRIKHSPNATFQIVADEAILIHLNTGVYYSLNDVGTSFWNLMDGQKTIGQCAEAIAAGTALPRTWCWAICWSWPRAWRPRTSRWRDHG